MRQLANITVGDDDDGDNHNDDGNDCNYDKGSGRESGAWVLLMIAYFRCLCVCVRILVVLSS